MNTFLSCGGHQKNLLMAGLIIDSEEYALVDTLKSLSDAGITTYMIFDSGNAPQTLQMASEFFKEKSIQPYISKESYKSDAQAKNHLLQVAQQHYPTTPFIILCNASWQLRNARDLVAFCEQEINASCSVYGIRMIRDTIIEWYEPCLIRNNAEIVFSGAAYAKPVCNFYGRVPQHIYGDSHPITYGLVRCKQNLERNKQLLLKQLNEKPNDIHTLFYLGQVCSSLNEFTPAFNFYLQCAQQDHHSEELFLACYKVACMVDSIAANRGHDCWPLALHYYLKAMEINPNRAEPYIKIAQHYSAHGEMKLAYFFARHAAQLPYPKDALLEVEKELYSCTRYDLLGQYAWYVGEYEVGEWAIEKALQAKPDAEYLQHNLQFYLDRKKNNVRKQFQNQQIQGFGIDFMKSMSHGFLFDATFLNNDPFAQKVRAIYDQYINNQEQTCSSLRIPRIIHQIWLGSPLPLKCKALQDTWLAQHPDWEYKLWTEKDIQEFGLYNKQAYDAACTYGEKADIARYEILYRIGGVYADTDFECVRPFDILHHCCDFFAGLERGEQILAGNSLIGSVPGHVILKHCIETLQQAQPGEGWQHVCNRTGPGHLTASIRYCIEHEENRIGRAVLFPTGYFFPWYPLWGEVRTTEKALQSLKPETFAVHHWHSSWVK